MNGKWLKYCPLLALILLIPAAVFGIVFLPEQNAASAPQSAVEPASGSESAAPEKDPDEAGVTEYEPILAQDRTSLSARYGLPALRRLSSQEESSLMEPLQVLQRMQALGVDETQLETPEKNWKKIYNSVRTALEPLDRRSAAAAFAGTSVSELNAFLQSNAGGSVLVESTALTMDETLAVPAGTAVYGSGTVLTPGAETLDKAILLDQTDGCTVDGFVIAGGCNYGIYVKASQNYVLSDNDVSGAAYKGITLMGENTNFRLCGNKVHENGNGGVFLDGDISRGIIEDNQILDNKGARNLTAGLVLSSIEIEDMDTAYNPFQDVYLYEILASPHDLVVRGNTVAQNHSSGIYSDSGYQNYYVGNTVYRNEKEGMCLDYGSFGNYVAENRIQQNGGRNRMSDEDLEADFILEQGRLADGSSPAKLPGISLDNAAYNTLYNNIVTENYGSGIKAVRSAFCNTILSNSIVDNNLGQNDRYHFFGIELSTDLNADQPVKGLDFAPCYENIVARNQISGAHYAGVFLGEDSYTNDLFDNTILGCGSWSMECLSGRTNLTTNNYSNVPSRGISLNGDRDSIALPAAAQ